MELAHGLTATLLKRCSKSNPCCLHLVQQSRLREDLKLAAATSSVPRTVPGRALAQLWKEGRQHTPNPANYQDHWGAD